MSFSDIEWIIRFENNEPKLLKIRDFESEGLPVPIFSFDGEHGLLSEEEQWPQASHQKPAEESWEEAEGRYPEEPIQSGQMEQAFFSSEPKSGFETFLDLLSELGKLLRFLKDEEEKEE